MPVGGMCMPVTGMRFPGAGEGFPVAGIHMPVAGMCMPVTGEPLPMTGERLPTRGGQCPGSGSAQRAARKAAEISSIRLRLTPKSRRPSREAERKWMRLAASSKTNSTSSTKWKNAERHSALR